MGAQERLARIRKQAVRHRRMVGVLLDGEVREQIEAVEDELDRLADLPDTDRRQNTKSPAARIAELEKELDRLRESAADSTLNLVLEAMSHTAFRALVSKYPPRKGEDGKPLPADQLLGFDLEAAALPLIRACVIGHRERPDADAPVEPVDKQTLDWLLGTEDVEEFVTERHVAQLGAAALALCVRDDAVPLPRRRSPTKTSADE